VKLRLAFAFCVLSVAASAATSTVWEISGFADFLKGRVFGLSLTADGALQLGPSVNWNVALKHPALWSIVLAPDHSIYASTGHQGKVFRISPDGKASVIWTAEQPEVFALAIDQKGVLYAGSSPNGGVYRIENGTARQIWASPAKYIWGLQVASNGSLYVGTGEQGRIYHIDPNGNSDVYYETGQSNITALALGSNGHLYAGSDPNGLLYEISGPQQGTILFDSNLPEIRAIAIDSNGCVYAAGMGGAVAARSPATSSSTATSSSGAVVAATPTIVTVTESNQQSGVKPAPEQSKTASSSTSSTATATPSAGVTEISGVEKSAIYRINPDRTVETLQSSKDDNVYDILLDEDTLLFSTDDHGRIYRLNGSKATLLAEPGDGETTRLLKSGSMIYGALSNPARLVALDTAGTGTAYYESQVHDSISVARWGHFQWHGTGSGVVFRTRTGNAARPDTTWSPWSEPISDPSHSLIQSPAARFIQWRAEWFGGSTAAINTVDVPYLPQNTPPVIRSITVTSVIGTNAAKSSSNTAANASSAYSITVTDTGDAPVASSASTTAQTVVSRLQTTQTQISWQAEDPDGDKLVYSVYFRADDEHDWQLIRSRMFENTLLLDPDVFADGRYFFRVVASDAPSNAPEYARQTELVSTPVLIDNTPPLVTLGPPQRNGAALDIDVDAVDKSSPLRLCEYSLDAGLWQPIEAVDGVTDTPHERFHLHLDRLRPGEHLLVFRVFDSANNAGLARVILR
jgi:hypothetical protein